MTQSRADCLLDGLTDPQRDAVTHAEGPLLVLAGPGSGKTRVITRRIAHLIVGGTPPWTILALTFTNKAAGEMRQRVADLLGDESAVARGLTVSTFHALCARLLRRWAEGIPGAGLTGDYTIYDTSDQVSLMKRVIAELGLNTGNWPPRSVLSAIGNAKNELLDPEAYGQQAHDFYGRQIAKLYGAYERALRSANAVDFDDLLVLTARLLRDNEEVREQLRHRWEHVLIDEYQDTNHAQLVIARLIAGERRQMPGMPGEFIEPNICVVGDPDQSIYGWRGADLSNILEFEEHYPSARVIALGENFRSTSPILAVADGLIRRNLRRKHKELFTSRTGGEPVEVALALDERHEASQVAQWLGARHEAGTPWREMAVFYRTNALSRVMEDELRARTIPYSIARGTAFFDREEVRSAVAYLRVLANPSDDVSLARIINTPARAIGKTTLARVQEAAQTAHVPVLRAMREGLAADAVGTRAAPALRRFVDLMDSLTGAGTFMGESITGSLADLVERVIRETGLEAMYAAQAQATGGETDAERLENLSELVSSAAEFEERFDPEADPSLSDPKSLARRQAVGAPPLLVMLRAYLESIALVADADAIDPAQGAVTLMTLHASKGLEFSAVALIGLEEGLLPHSRSQESPAALEEERRLCFVGITRAMDHLRLSCARYRTHRGFSERSTPSRFLDELDEPSIVRVDLADSDEFIGDEGTDLDRAPNAPGATSPARGAARLFPPGCAVRHEQFGVGRVIAVMAGTTPRARVDFRDVGVKTLVLEFARLRRIDPSA
ncbi:MAG: UvrD-helicase domain-containing protein [Phycisphaeraceae bacterium]|nr:UvrD-helicase domain-containing protein [Phycisphaeraceae bacterium]